MKTCPLCGGVQFIEYPHSEYGCPGREREAYTAGRLAGFEEGLLAAEQERELHRQEALALHARYLKGELTEAQYQRQLLDIGKPDDDLTREDAR